MNFKKTDDELAKIVGGFWQLVWAGKSPAIPQKTKYLLSLANAVGARRFRQATRELVKAYAAGTTIAELDELFCLFVWNQGAGEFASEIGPSSLFATYQMAKEMEKQDASRDQIRGTRASRYGECPSCPYRLRTGRAPEETHHSCRCLLYVLQGRGGAKSARRNKRLGPTH